MHHKKRKTYLIYFTEKGVSDEIDHESLEEILANNTDQALKRLEKLHPDITGITEIEET